MWNIIRAIGHITFLEGLRSRVTIAIFIFIGLVLGIGPFLWMGAANEVEKFKFLLSLISSASALLVLFIATFIPAISLGNELKNKQIYQTMTKPVSSWALVTGKWFGLMKLITFCLISMFIISVIFIRVLLVSTGGKAVNPLYLEKPSAFYVDEEIPAKKENMKEGDIDAGKKTLIVSSGEKHTKALFVFKGLDKADYPSGTIEVEIQPYVFTMRGMGGIEIAAEGPARREVYQKIVHRVEKTLFAFSAEHINDKGELRVSVRPTNPEKPIGLTIKRINFVKGRGLFEINLLKFYFGLFLSAAVVGAFSTLGATFLTGGVAVVLAMFLTFAGVLVPFVKESSGLDKDASIFSEHSHESKNPGQKKRISIVEKTLRFCIGTYIKIYPNLGKFDKEEDLVEARLISVNAIFSMMLWGFVYTGVILLFGGGIAWQREFG
jgi:ABC-type transport system involved in multi-copper enzyme maturation permease subunit